MRTLKINSVGYWGIENTWQSIKDCFIKCKNFFSKRINIEINITVRDKNINSQQSFYPLSRLASRRVVTEIVDFDDDDLFGGMGMTD